jgi:hypothetical protein
MIGGESWMQFSFNIPWEERYGITRFVAAASRPVACFRALAVARRPCWSSEQAWTVRFTLIGALDRPARVALSPVAPCGQRPTEQQLSRWRLLGTWNHTARVKRRLAGKEESDSH